LPAAGGKRHLHPGPGPKAGGPPQTVMDQNEKATRTRNHLALEWDSVHGAMNPVAAAAWTEGHGAETPPRGRVEGDLERETLVALEHDRRESSRPGLGRSSWDVNLHSVRNSKL
jgi:hypothetical protein